jgi:hypothetical protein
MKFQAWPAYAQKGVCGRCEGRGVPTADSPASRFPSKNSPFPDWGWHPGFDRPEKHRFGDTNHLSLFFLVDLKDGPNRLDNTIRPVYPVRFLVSAQAYSFAVYRKMPGLFRPLATTAECFRRRGGLA